MSTASSPARQFTRRQACVLGVASLAGVAAGCVVQRDAKLVRVESVQLGALADSRPVQVHTLRNRHGLLVRVMDYGATMLAVNAPDRHGNATNVVCGAATLEAYLKGFPAGASVIGRYANRIRNARFPLDGREVQVTANAGQHHIHGGREGFAGKLWTPKTRSGSKDASVELSLRSADGEEGFPGNLAVTVTYTLNDDNELVLHYAADTDRPTVVNLTNHAYFNLAGGGDIYGHEAQIFADEFTPGDADLIPTGEITSLTGTPLDFRSPHRIGERIAQIQGPSGYDHNFVLRGRAGTLRPAARVVEPLSGRVLECHTTEPGVQLYTANHFSGRPYPKHGAFCLETQHYPDSPNRPQFPSTVVRPGTPFQSETRFKFTTVAG
jgi:aldose 1-epimerase